MSRVASIAIFNKNMIASAVNNLGINGKSRVETNKERVNSVSMMAVMSVRASV